MTAAAAVALALGLGTPAPAAAAVDAGAGHAAAAARDEPRIRVDAAADGSACTRCDAGTARPGRRRPGYRPEPTTLALWLTGLAALGGWRRRGPH